MAWETCCNGHERISRIDIESVRIIPVPCQSSMAKASAAAPCRQRFRQLVLSSNPQRRVGLWLVSLNPWRSDLAARHKLLLAGLGWCGMPERSFADIESGRLDDEPSRLAWWRIHHAAIHKTYPPGPAGRWLIERLAARLTQPRALFKKFKSHQSQGPRTVARRVRRAVRGDDALLSWSSCSRPRLSKPRWTRRLRRAEEMRELRSRCSWCECVS